ncbi:hypothetical protein ABW21_db0203484 [Orbilia brochopaga]|nr:hypothetical protein ABW21_db0203484 [Drechslerella brochopaga]
MSTGRLVSMAPFRARTLTTRRKSNCKSSVHLYTDAFVNKRVRYYALLLGLFVPWDQLAVYPPERTRDHHVDFEALWAIFLRRLPKRVRFYADNFELLRKSRQEKIDDMRMLSQLGGEVWDRETRDVATDQFEEQYFESVHDDNELTPLRIGRGIHSAVAYIGNRFDSGLQLELLQRSDGGMPMNPVEAGLDIGDPSLLGFAADRDLFKSWRSTFRDIRRSAEENRFAVDPWRNTMGSADEPPNQHSRLLGAQVCQRHDMTWVTCGISIAEDFGLNRKQTCALLTVAIQLDGPRRYEEPVIMYLSGEGGTGKTRVIEAIREMFAQMDKLEALELCAFAGTAAFNIGGRTLHSSLGLRMHAAVDDARNIDLDSLDGGTTTDMANRWSSKEMLIIDEISMVGGKLLARVNAALQRHRSNFGLMGGLPVVMLVGDMYQLKPVRDTPLYTLAGDTGLSGRGAWALSAKSIWTNINRCIHLDQQMRQSGDLEFHSLLQRLRYGRLSLEDVNMLQERLENRPPESYPQYLRPSPDPDKTYIVRNNSTRDYLNLTAAKAFAIRNVKDLYLFAAEHTCELPSAVTQLLRGGDSVTGASGPGVFVFVEGMPVMLNINDYRHLGLANGSEGVARDFVIDETATVYQVAPRCYFVTKPPKAVLVYFDKLNFEIEGLDPGVVPVMRHGTQARMRINGL